MFLSIKLNSFCDIYLETFYRNYQLSTTVGLQVFSFVHPLLLCAIIPIKSSSNAETDKEKILFENKNKSGIYM